MIISRNKEYKEKKIMDGQFLPCLFIGTLENDPCIFPYVFFMSFCIFWIQV